MSVPTTPTSTAPECLTVDRHGLAQMLGVSVETVDKYRDQLPTPIRIGARLLWTRQAVLDYLHTQTRRARA